VKLCDLIPLKVREKLKEAKRKPPEKKNAAPVAR
jgi:hypothetical protein